MSWFQRLAFGTAERVGSARAFVIALVIVFAWAVTGPIFHFSDSWQLVINTGTTIVTFLVVFLIQATQNRESRAVHLKLDELIRTQRSARNSFTSLEHATDEELATLEREFTRIRERSRRLHGGEAAEERGRE